jgi:cellulose biosynthesis protein BcsQ
VLFDCPPAIGYQSLNAAFAADLLYVPTGPGYWEYDSTTSFLGQLADALEDIEAGFGPAAPRRRLRRRQGVRRDADPDDALRGVNELHQSMAEAYRDLFGDIVCAHPIELSRAVEQSGRLQTSVYEQDYREMTRETWKRARLSFDRAYGEFRSTMLAAWAARETPLREAS